jgi:alpha-mannosidase
VSDVAPHLVVVPHTHWDREWYRTQEEFRLRLVRLLDRLLPLLEGDPSFRHFSLDGQTIVVDDYLEVRPEARERLAKLVRDGRLVVGPWYVLPDEWLVSGEALIRNLRLGLREAAALGGSNPVGYVPDQFGHVGQLPQLLRGFGLEGAVLWRGVGKDVSETTFWWEAPDGTRLFTVYMPLGYGNAALLPLEPEGLAARLAREIEALGPFSRIPTLLLMNGSDHLEPQAGLPAALEAAAARLGVGVEIGTVLGFLRRARAEARPEIPLHRGELRSGLRAPLLPGCASSRMPQKQRDFRNDRLLVRYLEPLSTWLAALGGEADPGLLDFAWRVALQNHPHDSICGCSVDRVHAQMEARFDRVEEIAGEELARVTRQLAARVAAPPAGRGSGDAFVVWNPNAGEVAQVEAELDLDVPGAEGRRAGPLRAHVRSADGRRVPAHVEILAPGLVWGGTFGKRLASGILPTLHREFLGSFVNDVTWQVEDDRLRVRVGLGATPSGELDEAGIKSALSRALAREEVAQVALEARRPPRVRLRFVDELPGHGLRAYRMARGPGSRRAEGAEVRGGRRAGGAGWIENAFWRVEATPDGRVRWRHASHDAWVEDALRVVSEGDRGDEYNFDPLPGAVTVERPERARVQVEHDTAEASLRVDARYRVPLALAPGRDDREKRRIVLPVRLRLRLARALDRLDLWLELDNVARDHRLRVRLRAPFTARRFEVESAFEVTERPIAPGAGDFGSERPAEFPIGAGPQRSFATLDDGVRAMTVANRGNAEVEAVPEPDGSTSLAVTLLRAVGRLSQTDLALRPVPAGPPFPTPGAQVPGAHRCELGLRYHAAGEPRRSADAHAFAFPPLAFAGGGPEDAALGDGARLLLLDDPSVLVSAIEPRPGGRALVRLYNGTPQARRVCLRWNAPGTAALDPVDLAGRVDAAVCLQADGPNAVLELRPFEIVSLRPR